VPGWSRMSATRLPGRRRPWLCAGRPCADQAAFFNGHLRWLELLMAEVLPGPA
jgi:hypothetical protein